MRGRRPRHRGQRGRCFACVDEGRAEGPRRCILGAIAHIKDRRRGVRGWGLGGLAGSAGRCRRQGRLWVRAYGGPDDATERVVDDRHVGFGLGAVRGRRRGAFSAGAGLLRDGARMVMRVILHTYGAVDAFRVWFGFRCVTAYVCRVKLGESMG